MSTITQSNNTRNQLFSAYDFSKVFLFDNKYRKVSIAASGSDLTITAGELIGIVSTVYQPYDSTTSNIRLVGVAAETITISDGDSADVLICIAGKVAEDKLLFNGTDTIDTVVDYKTLREHLESDTLGIELASTDELTAADNV
jgi:hypothetical protein